MCGQTSACLRSTCIASVSSAPAASAYRRGQCVSLAPCSTCRPATSAFRPPSAPQTPRGAGSAPTLSAWCSPGPDNGDQMQRLHARAGCIPKQTRANSAMGVKEGNSAQNYQ
eukprot:scaffold14147_cov48-Phaeocystis_antarctica.AAC.2